jgi:tyrosine-protein kinase Etk/Wzc
MISRRTENTTMALDFIDRQIKALDKRLEISEERLKSLKEKERLVSLSDKARATLEQLVKSDMELKRSERLKRQAEFINENIAKNVDVSGTEIFALGTGLESPRLLTLAEKLSDLQSRRITLRTNYKEKHPSIIETDMQIAETKKNIKAELSSVIASIRVQRESIRSDMAGYESRIRTLPDAEKRLAELTRDAVAQQDIYSFLLQKKQELEVARASEIGNIRIVDPAIPGDRIKPKVRKSILLALIVGLFMGVGIAFFLEYLDNTIKNPDDLKQITELPLLGSIAKFDTQTAGNGKELITHTMPHAGISEAFRTIRTNLFFASFDTPKRLIGVTSALPGEGKTLFVANLAVSIAQADKKVLLIDADMRRPRLHRIFSQKRAPGLSNIIMARSPEEFIDRVIRRPPIEGMEAIFAGDIPHNPSELLGSQKMKGIIDLVSDRYDYILFDCSPVLSVSDPVVLANRLDGIIFVINAGKTEKNALMQELEAIPDEKELGMVLNNIDIERDRYYYRYYQYYYSYGDQDESAGKKGKRSLKSKTRIKKALSCLQDKNPWKQT